MPISQSINTERLELAGSFVKYRVVLPVLNDTREYQPSLGCKLR